jgi:quinol-cytochrome oxidoreductase complex cytochrome b subunit
LGWRTIWNSIFLRKVPKVNWFVTFGSATLFLAINQAITGILLTIYYAPTPDHAYDSVQYITTQVPAGWLIRGLHHWGASAMVLLTVLHMIRVIFHGAYKFPREITWFTGVALLLIVVAFGFTGYLLPWDQKAFWATTVELTAVTLARFFGAHVWFLPAALALLIAIHLYLVVRIGISSIPKKGE